MEIKKQTKENSDGTAKEKVRERLKREREMLSKEQVQQDRYDEARVHYIK